MVPPPDAFGPRSSIREITQKVRNFRQSQNLCSIGPLFFDEYALLGNKILARDVENGTKSEYDFIDFKS
jgi:hypothetical protein